MRVLFVTGIDFDRAESAGVRKKVLYQVNALENLGHEVMLMYYTKNAYVLCNSKGTVIDSVTFQRKSYKYFTAIGKMAQRVKVKKEDLIYIRHYGIDIFTFRMLQTVKKTGARIILEVPTFPFSGEERIVIKRWRNRKNYAKILAFYINKVISRCGGCEV